MKFLPGVKTCKSGILCTKARYSFLAGSITKNGIWWSFHKRSSKLTENVVFPEPGVPTINICLVRSFSDMPMVSPCDEDFNVPTIMSPPPTTLSAYVRLAFPDSFTESPAYTLSLPTGSRNNSDASSAVMT